MFVHQLFTVFIGLCEQHSGWAKMNEALALQ